MEKWIIDNIIEFNNISNKKYQNDECYTYRIFNQFKDWYYIPSIDKFGPSKFIGYEKTTLDNYIGNGHGGKTNIILQQYFLKIEKNKYQKLYDRLFSKISLFAMKINKKLSRKIDRDDRYGGGIYVPKKCDLRKVENNILGDIDSQEIEESIPNLMGSEGKRTKVLVNKYERDPRLRAKAIEIHGLKCKACGFDFEKVYGKYGKGYIEVHHITPLSLIGDETEINPEKDMTVLCANCHRIIHRIYSNTLTLEKLKLIIRRVD